MKTAIQVALGQIDDGPWTVTPAPRRETNLQSRLASLFSERYEFVDEYDVDASYGRFDNMAAVVDALEQCRATGEQVQSVDHQTADD